MALEKDHRNRKGCVLFQNIVFQYQGHLSDLVLPRKYVVWLN